MKHYIICLFLFITIFTSCKTQSDISNVVSNENDVKIVNSSFDKYINLHRNLKENSGLIFYDQLLWTVNDSGGENIIYGVDNKGKIVRRVKITNAQNVDWESITQDEQFIYVGDFGNNSGKRKDLCIYKVIKSNITEETDQNIKATKITFDYQDQTEFNFSIRSTPHDCEAMISYGDNLYLFSKNWKNFTTTVYKVSKLKGHYNLSAIDKYNVNLLVTAAHLSPDNKDLALLGYNNYMSYVWIFKNISPDNFFDGAKELHKFKNLYNAQTEGICYKDPSTLLISCEKTSAYQQQIFKVAIN